jgi:thiol-disulfide isomerase/thioredoxin
MIKKVHGALTVWLACLSLVALAQPGLPKQPPQGFPPLRMLQVNGAFYTAADLPRNKPVVIIYFAPDCDHCQVLMNELFKKMAGFKHTQLVMVTYVRLSEVAAFEKQYQTARYPNIKVGTEGNTFLLRQYYHLVNTPYTAVYDRNRKLVCAYATQTPVDALVAQVKKLR